jgi:hypothetical protein
MKPSKKSGERERAGFIAGEPGRNVANSRVLDLGPATQIKLRSRDLN